METLVTLTESHRQKLRLLAARLRFKSVATEAVVEFADELLNAGVYDDSLLAIIDAQPRTQAEVIPPFLKLVERSGLSLPDREKAVWVLLAHHVSRIANSPEDPFSPLDDLISELYWDFFESNWSNPLGESHGIQHLLRNYWQHDEILDWSDDVCHDDNGRTEAIAALKESIMNDARNWIRDWSHMSR